jgi:hypothetical protein
MEWAAGNLLRQDWPVNNMALQVNAQEELKSLAEVLKTAKRQAEADRMTSVADRYKIRDLVIELSCQGEAGLAMQVKEPIGTIASFEQRQTPGGGTLIGDSLSDPTSAYVAAEAFPGEYEVTIRRLWGQPLGSKVKLKIIQHKGTPEQAERIETVVLDRDAKVKVVLDQGRRTSLAPVAPAAPPRKTEAVAGRKTGSDQVFNKLRALADPELMMSSDSPVKGGLGSMGVAVDDRLALQGPGGAAGPVAGQQGIPGLGFANNGIDLTAQANLESNRDGTRYVRLSVAPVFQTVPRMAGFTAQPVVVPGIGGQ